MKLNTKSVRVFTDKHLEHWDATFRTLYEEELLTDCTLCCTDGSIKAHKLILASSSSYFRKVFAEHANDKAVFIMYGVKFDQLKELIKLIYRGCINIGSEQLSSIIDLAQELQVNGVLVEGSDTNYSKSAQHRDTRYKGSKRVAVDFERSYSPPSYPKNGTDIQIKKEQVKHSQYQESVSAENRGNPPDQFQGISQQDIISVKEESSTDDDMLMGHCMDDPSKMSAWARKERKFQCEVCPSSFKRASHLSRHQLVHTGERPFACDQCEKAFSRHDKLKHHVQKAHELDILNQALPPDSLYTIGHVQILTPEQTMIEIQEPIDLDALDSSEMEDSKSFSTNSGSPNPVSYIMRRQKKRGRPRKHPPVPIPTVKRPRGRPRIRPIVPPSTVKRPRGRPRIHPKFEMKTEVKQELEYPSHPVTEYGQPPAGEYVPQPGTECALIPVVEYGSRPATEYMPETIMINEDLSTDSVGNCQDMMEPLVEIKTEPQDTPIAVDSAPSSASFFENIGLFENSAIAKIGECTISVAPAASNPLALTSSDEIL